MRKRLKQVEGDRWVLRTHRRHGQCSNLRENALNQLNDICIVTLEQKTLLNISVMDLSILYLTITNQGIPVYRVFIKYCVFFRIIKNIPDSVFPLCQCV